MKLLYDAPKEISDIIKNYNFKKVHYAVFFDLVDSKYADGYLYAADDTILIFHNGKLFKEMRISDYDKFTSKSVIGGGYICACKNGKDTFICSSTRRDYPKIATVALGLTSLIENGCAIYDSTPETYCPICKKPYIPGTQICMRCDKKSGVIKKLMHYVKRYSLYFILIFILMIIPIGFSLVNPMINEKIVDGFLSPAAANGSENININEFFFWIFIMVALFIINSLIAILRGRLNAKLGNSIVRDMRNDVYEKIHSLSINSVAKKSTGGLISRVTSDTQQLQRFLCQDLPNILVQSLTLIAVTTVVLFLDWKLALMILLPVPVVCLLIFAIRNSMKFRNWRHWNANSKVNNVLHDILSGIRVVKSYGQEQKEINRFKKACKNFRDIAIDNERFWAVTFPTMGFIMTIGQFMIIYFGANNVLNGSMPMGALVKWISYTSMIYAPLRFFSMIPRMITSAMTSASKIFEVMDEECDVIETELPKNTNIGGEIEFKNVRFGYLSHEPVLNNINFKIHPGEMIGIVGHSGSGKSTLINLLMRLYDPNEGEILIDNVPLKDISSENYRHKMGVVLQETFLFKGTIYDNIRYAKPDATFEEIIQAAKVASAHDFITKLPNGYETEIGEKGLTLSGGERQRVAIARAILNDPKILILDEATSALDTETEKIIQDALTRLIKGRTTFAIAHRLSTLKNADRLIVLNKGKLVEMGNHKELLAKKGHYYKLVMAQRMVSNYKKAN